MAPVRIVELNEILFSFPHRSTQRQKARVGHLAA